VLTTDRERPSGTTDMGFNDVVGTLLRIRHALLCTARHSVSIATLGDVALTQRKEVPLIVNERECCDHYPASSSTYLHKNMLKVCADTPPASVHSPGAPVLQETKAESLAACPRLIGHDTSALPDTRPIE
jgi:hypothetical protein